MPRTSRKDEIELSKAAAKKAARSLTRLKVSLIADRVLNDLIPDIDDAVDKALADGTAWEFNVEKLIADALGVAMPALTEGE